MTPKNYLTKGVIPPVRDNFWGNGISCLGNKQISVFDGKNALTSHGEVFVLDIIFDFRVKTVQKSLAYPPENGYTYYQYRNIRRDMRGAVKSLAWQNGQLYIGWGCACAERRQFAVNPYNLTRSVLAEGSNRGEHKHLRHEAKGDAFLWNR